MKVVDLANEIWIEMGEPSSTSVPAIAFWIRGQVGQINSLLFEDFEIQEGDEYNIVDGGGTEISINAASIIKKLYLIYDYDLQIRSQMNALASDTLLSFKEADGSSFTRTNRNEISKTLASLKKDEMAALKALISAYRANKASALQVAGDDTVPGIYGGDVTNTPTLRTQY